MDPVNTKPYQLPAQAVWLITGCSSGIGRALATLIASRPRQRLIATARKLTDLSYLSDDDPDILKLVLDVTSPTSVNGAFASVEEKLGKDTNIDVVVNNAGYSLSGDTEAATEEETHREIETLFFGTARVTMQAVRVMRQSKNHQGGIIFNISSLAGVCGFAGHAYYHAGKFAVEGFSESVAREMHPDWNINFCIVEPSGVRTNFEGHSKARIQPHPAYAAEDMPSRKLEKYVERGLKSGMLIEPSAIADSIYHIASRGECVPLRLPLGAAAWGLSKAKHEGALQGLDAVKEMSLFTKKLN
ncbi:hypothetical protein B0I35DRAFT_435587 [Stachybotrys elegans]|uniref:Ketoreductase domain-containing protein n=1 Tax=Stachybotrys elegans TaxID=80388 RepID=A0A8K0SM52_9HYPO|nr:hypothetical protein B0I35DRAFT_435587 [Stachybotrys elegans]